MDYSTSRERRRAAAASRRAARSEIVNTTHENDYNNGNGNISSHESQRMMHHNTTTTTTPRRIKKSPHRRPLEKSFLSSLSQALTNIDRHNNDYFSSDNNAGTNNINSGSINGNSMNNNNSSLFRKSSSSSSRKPTPPTNFTSYLKFTKLGIYTLLCFTSCYILLLFCTLPMISYVDIDTLETTTTDNGTNEIKKGASFQRIRGRIQYQHVKQHLGTLKQRAIQWEENAKRTAHDEAIKLQEEERQLFHKFGVVSKHDIVKSSQLLEEAIGQFEDEMEEEIDGKIDQEIQQQQGEGDGQEQHYDEHWTSALVEWDKAVGQTDNNNREEGLVIGVGGSGSGIKKKYIGEENKRPGFIVLGMHRSGTSMLSGLLVEGFGYETGGPLIMPAFDNEKGFYERIDVVLQNDEFFSAQHMGWSFNVINYDSEKALRDKLQGRIKFDEGKRALQFLNNHHKTLPYLQKDPRMCIALPTWLKLLDDEPAVVFTYRHPLEVAMSLKKREASITLEHGLRLWIVYNMRAIQNSVGLCRVFSTNEAVLKDPSREVQRIKNQLTDECNVIPPPSALISQKVVDSFIDPNLQHNNKARKKEEKVSGILKDFGDGCVAKEFDSDYKKGSSNYEAEKQIFLMAMQIFCDFENGKAYEEDYDWPDLIHWQRPARIN